MPKGEKIRAKARNVSATTWEFWKSRVRVFVCQITLVCILLSKVGLLWEEYLIMGIFDYGKWGEFLKSFITFSLNNSIYVSTSVFDLEIGNWVWFAKTKPSGGKEWSIYAIIESKQSWVLIWIDFALVLLALCCVGINHQKGGDWKGNVPLGHF
jgi:hypothetical protein